MQALKKDRIKDRMLKNTARLWGVSENEIETNYDPLILLMLDACASELEKLGYNINASQARLLDQLAGMVLPETFSGPQPASCIMQATPLGKSAKLLPDTKFYTSQKLPSKEGSVTNSDFYFTPVGEFLVHNAQLTHLIAGKKVFSISENNSKSTLHGDDAGESSSIQEIWLVITPEKTVASLKGLNIYFDLRGHSEANAFYKSLSNAQGYINGKNIALEQGYFQKEQFELSPEEMLLSGNDDTRKICRNIASIYQQQFLHIQVESTKISTDGIPAELAASLPEDVRKQLLTEAKIYLKIELNRSFSAELFDVLTCNINAFPIINRKYTSINYRTDTWVNIVPLQIEGHFFDLQDIISSSGKPYQLRAAADKQEMEEGEASVRSNGIGKTDSKEVREIIGNLTEAIRDESAYFSEITNEFLLARLREISQILARLEDQLAAAKDNRLPHHYVLLRPKQRGDRVTINYWTTNAEEANNIKSGSLMQAHNHTLVNAKTSLTITNTLGGKSVVTDAEKKLLLKQQLMSKGKIISAEDIKLLSHQLFREKLKHVAVKKGIQIGENNTDGFVRTIEVHLTLQQGIGEKSQQEVDYLCRALEHQLSENATPVYPFKIILT